MQVLDCPPDATEVEPPLTLAQRLQQEGAESSFDAPLTVVLAWAIMPLQVLFQRLARVVNFASFPAHLALTRTQSQLAPTLESNLSCGLL